MGESLSRFRYFDMSAILLAEKVSYFNNSLNGVCWR